MEEVLPLARALAVLARDLALPRRAVGFAGVLHMPRHIAERPVSHGGRLDLAHHCAGCVGPIGEAPGALVAAAHTGHLRGRSAATMLAATSAAALTAGLLGSTLAVCEVSPYQRLYMGCAREQRQPA